MKMKKICIRKYRKVVTVNPFVFGGKHSLAKSLLNDDGDPFLTTEAKGILKRIGTDKAILELYSNYNYYLDKCFDRKGIRFLHGKKGKDCSERIGSCVNQLRVVNDDYKRNGIISLKKYFNEEEYKQIVKACDKGKAHGMYGPFPQNALYILIILWYWSKKYPSAKFHVY